MQVRYSSFKLSVNYKFILLIISLLLAFCKNDIKSNNNSKNADRELFSENESQIYTALKFINTYVENSNKMKHAVGIIEWTNSNTLITKGFKTELNKIIDEAHKKDPELGLDFDPLFDAQDYPTKGFELEEYDKKTNYLTVKGKNWPEFKLTMKVIKENKKWLVDGCGIVNIPEDKKQVR